MPTYTNSNHHDCYHSVRLCTMTFRVNVLTNPLIAVLYSSICTVFHFRQQIMGPPSPFEFSPTTTLYRVIPQHNLVHPASRSSITLAWLRTTQPSPSDFAASAPALCYHRPCVAAYAPTQPKTILYWLRKPSWTTSCAPRCRNSSAVTRSVIFFITRCYRPQTSYRRISLKSSQKCRLICAQTKRAAVSPLDCLEFYLYKPDSLLSINHGPPPPHGLLVRAPRSSSGWHINIPLTFQHHGMRHDTIQIQPTSSHSTLCLFTRDMSPLSHRLIRC